MRSTAGIPLLCAYILLTVVFFYNTIYISINKSRIEKNKSKFGGLVQVLVLLVSAIVFVSIISLKDFIKLGQEFILNYFSKFYKFFSYL